MLTSYWIYAVVSGFYGLFVTGNRRDGLLWYVSIAYRGETVGVLKVKGRGYVRARTHETFLSHMQIISSIVSPRTRTHATSQLIALCISFSCLAGNVLSHWAAASLSLTLLALYCPQQWQQQYVRFNGEHKLPACLHLQTSAPTITIFHKKTYHEWISF